MAKFEFWVKVKPNNQVIEIPDSELEGLSDEEQNDVILKHHVKWANNAVYGGWMDITKLMEESAC